MNTISRIKAEQANQRAYRDRYNRTFNELSAMSDRDLTDIGLSRGDIPGIAAQAAVMK